MIETTTPDIHPFPGLRPFQSGEHYLFFGREAQSDDLLGRLQRHRVQPRRSCVAHRTQERPARHSHAGAWERENGK